MTLSGFYLSLALFSFFSALTVIVRARKLYFMTPLYFLTAWLTGELALHHIAWQLTLSVICVFLGVLATTNGQLGLVLLVLSWLLLLRAHGTAMKTTPQVYKDALSLGLGENFREDIPTLRRQVLRDAVRVRDWIRPFTMRCPGVKRVGNIAYGDAGKRNLLDVYSPSEPVTGGAPVLLQVHGGAWVIGHKREQALPLMYHLAQRGWVCVAINYRLSPADSMPAHIIDVKKAIAWIREHIAEYGGNPDFVAITGGSAGGHLSSLAALTPNKADWQPGFEEVDTSIQAAVPFYGIYDFLDSEKIRDGMSMEGFLAKNVFQCQPQEDLELWQQCSTINHVSAEAPPMFVIHGTHDSLAWNEEGQDFVGKLREVATQPVVHAELEGAQHAFEMFHSPRTEYTLNAVAEFLEWAHARWLTQKTIAPE
ncbi:MAG: acetyl esterase/lipase [Halieaceae bacterium]|jgi:acetyl esterase/lipase